MYCVQEILHIENVLVQTAMKWSRSRSVHFSRNFREVYLLTINENGNHWFQLKNGKYHFFEDNLVDTAKSKSIETIFSNYEN